MNNLIDKDNFNKNSCINVMQIVGDPVGGIRKHVHSIILGLEKNRFKQSYAYSINNIDSKFKAEIKTLEEYLSGSILPLSVKKKPNISDLINLKKIGDYIRNKEIHILHGHGAKGGLYARILAHHYGIKAIYTPHGGVAHKMFSPFEDKLYTTVERLLFKMTDFFIFESRYTAENYFTKIGLSSNKFIINYNGVSLLDIETVASKSLAYGYSLPPHDQLHVGVFGMLRPQKGQIFAIKAIADLLKQGKSVYLHLFGDGPSRSDLMQAVESLGITSKVVFHGDVSEVEPHIFAMDIILIPSLFESFGYVAIEAMALCKPIIASKVGGLCEIILDGETGTLVEPANHLAISNAIIDYLHFPDKLKQHSVLGYERFKTYFTEERMINTIMKVYENVKNQAN